MSWIRDGEIWCPSCHQRWFSWCYDYHFLGISEIESETWIWERMLEEVYLMTDEENIEQAKECKRICAAEELWEKLQKETEREEQIRLIANFTFGEDWKGCRCGCNKV